MTRKKQTKSIIVSAAERLEQLGTIANDFSSWKPACEVLTRVEAQPTIFPSLDIATRVGGWPNRRVSLVHGPSSHGKTSLALGIGDSYLRAGHFFALIDAEFATPGPWLQTLMKDRASQPNFVAMRPQSYEEAVEGIRELVNKIAEARIEGKIPADTTCFIVVDSLRKLTPKGLLTKLLKGSNGMDGAKGRAAMMKAALNAQWLDELTPMLYHTNASLMFIARETENPSAQPWEPKFKVGGGRAVLYDSSLAVRVTRHGYVTRGADENTEVLGERHRLTIHKTKVGGKEAKDTTAFFHTSNGKLTPPGFDRARDVVQLALDLGLVARKGSWISDESTGERWQGIHNMVKALSDEPKMCELVELRCRDMGAVKHAEQR